MENEVLPHKVIKGRVADIPIISMDYAFMNDDKDKNEDKDKGMPILMMKDKHSNSIGQEWPRTRESLPTQSID